MALSSRDHITGFTEFHQFVVHERVNKVTMYPEALAAMEKYFLSVLTPGGHPRSPRVARLSRGSDRRGLPHGKEGGLRDYSCTHRDGEGKGRKIFQDPKHDHFSLIST